MHVSGSGADSGYSVEGLTLRAGALDAAGEETLCPYDARAYTGVRFFACGMGGSVRVKGTIIESQSRGTHIVHDGHAHSSS